MKIKTCHLLLTAGLILSLSACSPAEESSADPVLYDAVDSGPTSEVIADGEIVPAQDVTLVFQASGQVVELLIAEGEFAQQGEVLFRLEPRQALQAQVEQAQLEWIVAQHALDDLFLYADAQKNEAYQNLLTAQEARDLAQQELDDFDEDAYDRDLERAKENVVEARQDVEDARDDLADYADLDTESTAYKNREDTLERREADLNTAEQERDEIKREYDQVHLDLEIAEANMHVAEEQYSRANPGPDQQLLAQAEQRLLAAEQQYLAAQEAITDLEITAPFAGTLVHVNISAGDFIQAGQPVAVLADTSRWHVETTDLNELEVVDIQVGDPVQIVLDAYPDDMLTGMVAEISGYAEIIHSDVTYPVRIVLDETDLDLHWKMSVIVTFGE